MADKRLEELRRNLEAGKELVSKLLSRDMSHHVLSLAEINPYLQAMTAMEQAREAIERIDDVIWQNRK